MVNTMILGGSGRGRTKVLSRNFPGGVTKCNEIIRVAVRIRNIYISRMKMWKVTTRHPHFSCPFLLHFILGKKHRYAAFKETR